MKRVLLRAPLLTNSGYGIHSRQIFEWLFEKKDIDLTVECLNWGNTSWMLDSEKDPKVKEIMLLSKKLEKPYDVTFQLQLPDEWDTSLGKYNVGISAVVETERCNPAWVDSFNKMNACVVPSTFTKNVVKRSGILNNRIHVVPEWFNDNIDGARLDSSSTDEELLNVTTNYNYLIISTLTAIEPELDRKNLVNTLNWIFEKHKGDDDVGIILKTGLGRGTKKDLIDTQKILKELVGKNKKTRHPKLYLLHGNMSNLEIASLYKHDKVKCLVSATRGEGYGLPIIEAAASGLPIIATNWSGHLEFLKYYNFLPVDYDMKEISEKKIDQRIFLKNFRWAEPRKESFFVCLEELRNNYDNIAKNCNDDAKTIREKFCKQSIKKIYDEIFKEIF